MAVMVQDIEPTDPIDTEALFDNFAGDDELLNEIVELFLRECPQRLAEMRRALANGDSQALELVAHSLKGSLYTLGACRAAAAAALVESSARRREPAVAVDACSVIEIEIARATAALRQLVAVQPLPAREPKR